MLEIYKKGLQVLNQDALKQLSSDNYMASLVSEKLKDINDLDICIKEFAPLDEAEILGELQESDREEYKRLLEAMRKAEKQVCIAPRGNNHQYYLFSEIDVKNATETTDIEKKDAIWGNDEVFVNHIENALDNNGDGKNFVYGITVQLHGDYHPIPESEYTMNVSGVQDPEKEGAWAYYIQQLEEVDKMVKDLIEMLSNREESTYVIFYGDHLPSIFVGAGDHLSTKQKYATPYFTWNNMGIKKAEGTNADSGKYEPDIKLYQLSTLMCNELNLSGSFMNRFHNIYKDSSSFNHEFSCIQYYKMYDENKNVTFTNDTYQIGMLPFSIEEITFDSESLSYHIKGERFTQDTYFCVDNKTVYNVKFISGSVFFY